MAANRTVVLSFLALFAGAQAVLAGFLEFGPVGLRDPEFAVRAERLRSVRDRERDRRLLVAFGSSRMAEGLRPAALPNGDDISLFNFGLIGAAPVTQRLALERLLNAGIRPDAVILEYWPPYLLESCGEREEDRLDPNRLAQSDWPIVGTYLRDSETAERRLLVSRLIAVWAHRFVLLNIVAHPWLPFERRQDFRWRPVDDRGWLPGKAADARNRDAHLAMSRRYYSRFLASDRFDPVGERAFRDLIAFCRDRSIAVILIWMPESSEFRSWYSPAAEQLAQSRFSEWGDRPGVQAIDARSWIDDARIGDGFHLDPAGADHFTRKLADFLRNQP